MPRVIPALYHFPELLSFRLRHCCFSMFVVVEFGRHSSKTETTVKHVVFVSDVMYIDCDNGKQELHKPQTSSGIDQDRIKSAFVAEVIRCAIDG